MKANEPTGESDHGPPDSEPSRFRFLWSPANIGLMLLLSLECAFGMINASDGVGDVLLWLIIGTVLVFNTLRRSPPIESDQRWWVWLICTLSTVRFLAFEYNDETRTAFWILIGMNLLADASLIALGRSFSLLPARREVRVGWMYRIVRHPAYSAYMIVDAVYVTLLPTPQNIAVLVGGAILFWWRATLEERLLMHDPTYRDYAKQTRWRFVPFVF